MARSPSERRSRPIRWSDAVPVSENASADRLSPRADQLVRIDVDNDMVRLHLMLLGMDETVMFPADEHCIALIRSRMTLTSAPRSGVARAASTTGWPAQRCLSAAR